MSSPIASSETLRLLVVEDNPVNQKVAARALQRLGYDTDVSEDGEKAVEAVKQRQYALIFMDCMMPKMDGYEATKAIRALEQGSGEHTPIVALTADTTSGNREKCLSAGMDDFMTKPIRMPNLQKAVEQWARRAPPLKKSA